MILEEIKALLTKNRLTISTAESCTGGNLQALLTSISGSSIYFNGGITAYNIDQKVKHLGVDREVAEPVECVSQEVCEQMVVGASKMFNTDVALSTTGFITDYLHYSIFLKDKVIIGDIIYVDKNMSREDVQKNVSLKILFILLDVLRNEYSPYLML